MEGKQKLVLTFALYQNEAIVRREMVAQDVVKVGKDAKSQLRVDDELASRMHAVIEVASPEDITLLDLGNETGTMVNGKRVNKCKINPGDQIQIGGTKIVLESVEPVAVAPVPAAVHSGGLAASQVDVEGQQRREIKLCSIAVVAQYKGMVELVGEIYSIADILNSPDALVRAQRLSDIYAGARELADELAVIDDAGVRVRFASRLASRVLKVLS